MLYYLHGLGDNEQMFLRSGGWSMIQDLWERRELGEFIIVTPAAGSSFYLNSRDGQYRYEDFLLQEFLPFIEGRYRVRAGRTSRGLAGISMGGYGALRLAFRRPDLFGSVATHSAAIVARAARCGYRQQRPRAAAPVCQRLRFARGPRRSGTATIRWHWRAPPASTG